MSPLQPVALFGLEVPPGDILVPVSQSFPATVRITMAAIDPTEEVEEDAEVPRRPRSTLKLVKQSIGDLDAESDEDDEYLRDLLLGGGDDDDEESEDEDEETNGGPSDPSKSKKALQAAALKELLDATKDEEDSDEEMVDSAPGKKKGKKATPTKAANAKGKAKAVEVEEEEEDDEEESEDESEDEDDELAGLDLEQFVVCTLDTEAQPLELTIGEEEKAFFVNSGTHTIYVTGNYVINEDHASDSEEEDSDEDDYDLPPELDELIGDESEDELDDIDGVGRVEEIDTDEEAPTLVETKKGKNKRPAEDVAEGLDELIAKEGKEDSKLSKKQAKKLKNNEGKAVAAEKDTPKSEKKVQFAKNLELGPTGSPAEKGKKAAATTGVKVVQGVKIDDRKVGAGRTAKSGDKVGMRYIGKLENGKVFDSNKKGAPFSFKLGKGEVIKGWDIGVAGMAVGGERRLTIPAHHAYGSKGVPGIPPHSTLIFDVKLLEIK
ncbi:fk506-binding protein 4 [Diaporthe amygdali]|uniref:fk506-binding protein 4 n=1 Tax=Phomopsis amygdali TaxID=1214568 RepID=UPI0022FDFC46|nr:fk506-binding protein 4 [Diaporthe amygdali]KAJ0121022.1 fk506-binding protein 4 [Diaporthe amygdali]